MASRRFKRSTSRRRRGRARTRPLACWACAHTHGCPRPASDARTTGDALRSAARADIPPLHMLTSHKGTKFEFVFTPRTKGHSHMLLQTVELLTRAFQASRRHREIVMRGARPTPWRRWRAECAQAPGPRTESGSQGGCATTSVHPLCSAPDTHGPSFSGAGAGAARRRGNLRHCSGRLQSGERRGADRNAVDHDRPCRLGGGAAGGVQLLDTVLAGAMSPSRAHPTRRWRLTAHLRQWRTLCRPFTHNRNAPRRSGRPRRPRPNSGSCSWSKPSQRPKSTC